MNPAHRLAHRTPFFFGWVVLSAVCSSQFVRNAAASLTIAVFVYPLSEQLGWSRTMIAGAATLGGLAASFVSPGVGWLIDRYGARIVLAVSVFILGLSTVSLAAATATVSIAGFTVPIAFWLAYGTGRVLFSSPLQIGASVVVSRWFIRLRGRASGILTMSHSAGMISFPLVAGLMIGSGGEWQRAWIALGVIAWAVALAPVALLVVQRPEDVGLLPDGDSAKDDTADGGAGAAEPEWTAKNAMRAPALWILATGTGALFLMQAGTNIHAAAYLRDLGLGQTTATLGITLNAAFLGIGGLAWGWIAERVPARFVMAAVASTMAVASALFITVDSVSEALAYSALFGFGLGGMLSVPPVAYADYFGRRSLGVIRGVTEPFSTLGQAIGAVLMGVVFDVSASYYWAFVGFAALGALTGLAVLLARPPSLERQPDPGPRSIE